SRARARLQEFFVAERLVFLEKGLQIVRERGILRPKRFKPSAALVGWNLERPVQVRTQGAPLLRGKSGHIRHLSEPKGKMTPSSWSALHSTPREQTPLTEPRKLALAGQVAKTPPAVALRSAVEHFEAARPPCLGR